MSNFRKRSQHRAHGLVMVLVASAGLLTVQLSASAAVPASADRSSDPGGTSNLPDSMPDRPQYPHQAQTPGDSLDEPPASSPKTEPGPVQSMSTATSNTVRNDDGSYTTTVSSGTLNYKTGSSDFRWG
jgi:hypothetical protein